MGEQEVLEIMRQALWVLTKVSAPLMAVALVVGLAISLVQALTQIQEMTLTFVPKILAMFVAIVLLAPFMLEQLRDFSNEMFDKIMHVGENDR
jgi:flagellar biosynthesis protein FliQ